MLFRSFLIGIFLLLSSCGYRNGTGNSICANRTISVPYIECDWDGTLTAEVIKQLSQSGTLSYRREGGSLILQAALIDVDDINVGFRYDRTTRRAKLKHDIIPVETRLIETVEVKVVDAYSGCVVLGPVQLSAFVDFDHDYYTTRNEINVFSLGQVTDYDEARDEAQRPLNYRLARKIVDFVNNSW